MNGRKRTGAEQMRAFPILSMLAAAVLAVYIFYGYNSRGVFQGSLGEEAAIISAVLNMPDSGLGVLLERFRNTIYDPPEVAGKAEEQDWPPKEALQKVEDKAPATESRSAGEPAPSIPDETRIPKIPDEYAAPVISENFAGSGSAALLAFGNGYIKNDTKLSDDKINEILETPFSLEFEDTAEPQVLIIHTHATESYEKYDRDVYDTRNTWRSTDNSNNMAAVGDAMREVLEENGIAVIHDTTQHDYPSYNGSYERSAETVSAYLEQYPSIKVVLDLHRDAMQRDEAIVKPVTVIDGKKAAQIMIITPCDDGKLDIPEWRENLRFAAAFQDYMEEYYHELTKPVYLCYRKYNMDLTTGSLLLEFGSNANTLDEAVYSARMAGQALSKLIWDSIYTNSK